MLRRVMLGPRGRGRAGILLAAATLAAGLVLPAAGPAAASPRTAVAPSASSKPGPGVIARIHIPRLGYASSGVAVHDGIDSSDLMLGFGHYPTTALPGEPGNFAVAGHRTSGPAPMRWVDRLRPGDKVYVETDKQWYVYTLVADRKVQPTDVWVVSDQPKSLRGLDISASLITLTTCHPLGTTRQRWVWWGELTDVLAGRPKRLSVS